MLASFLRSCGHSQEIDLDERSEFFQRKVECIARTRCRNCVLLKEAADRAAGANQKAERHKKALARKWREFNKQKQRLEEAKKKLRRITIKIEIDYPE